MSEATGSTRNRVLKIKPLKYGDFLFPGTRTYSKKKQCVPTIEELRDIMESEDHSIPLGELLSRLDTDSETGLREDQVDSVRERYGENVISQPDTGNILTTFKNKVRGTYYLHAFGIIFCFTTACIPSLRVTGSFALDDVYTGIIMVFMIIVSSCFSYFHEKRSDKVMSSLKDLYPYHTIVIRDGKKVLVARRDIVVGDLVRFQEGDSIPADIRITKASNLEVEEAPLIFKGSPAIKTAECTSKNPTISQNVAFFGTSCIKGTGQGIVIATGNLTAYGQMMKRTAIFQKMDTTTHKTVKKIRLFGVITSVLSLIMLAICMHLYFWATAVILILSQMIASMPEILYSAVTACLYQSASEMAMNHCLPKDFEAIERLVSVSVICCSKTGIITQGKMTVVRLWLDGKIIDVSPTEDRSEITFDPRPHRETWKAFSRAACLCSRTFSKRRRDRGIIKEYSPGDQLEIAIMELIIYTSRNNSSTEELKSTRRMHKKLFEVPFNTHRKYQVTIHELSPDSSNQESAFLLCMKGAVETILDFCSTVFIEGENVPISQLKNYHFDENFKTLMKDGEQIIGFCDRELPNEAFPDGYVFQESNIPLYGMRFLGFVSVMDPPKEDVQDAVARCRKAGIKVIIMTGDHRITAKSIARQVGIISPNSETIHEVAERFNISPKEVPLHGVNSVVITGSELETMDKEKLRQCLRCVSEIVFARINPRQKYDVIRCLQKDGEVVAFTGHSSEDTSTMIKADIGIGMTKRGCDISRGAADIVLLGDSFGSLVAGIEKGQLIYRNLQNAITYVLSSNVPELSPIFAVCILHIPFTIGASFILLITLLAEMFPVLMIVQENSSHNIMRRGMLGPAEFFDYRLVTKSYFQVGVIGFFSGLFLYFAIMAKNGFMPLRVFGIVHVWNSRAINDLIDSYNQEWTYNARKSLEHTCHTGFFLAVIVLQLFNIKLLRPWRNPCQHSNQFLITCVLVPVYQVSVILFLIYTPGISRALHFHPIRITEWILCLPLPIFYLIYEELRRFIIFNSKENSWLARETI